MRLVPTADVTPISRAVALATSPQELLGKVSEIAEQFSREVFPHLLSGRTVVLSTGGLRDELIGTMLPDTLFVQTPSGLGVVLQGCIISIPSLGTEYFSFQNKHHEVILDPERCTHLVALFLQGLFRSGLERRTPAALRTLGYFHDRKVCLNPLGCGHFDKREG